MNETFKACVLLALMTLSWAPPAFAVLARLSDDAYTTATTTTNYGAKPVLKVQDTTSNDLLAWLKFDLSTLPTGTNAAAVAKATLSLYIQKLSTTGQFEVKPVITSWDEASVNGSTPPNLGSTIGTVTITGISSNARYDYVAIDLTATVQGWVSSPATNLGVALVPVGTSLVNVQLDSKESKSTGQAPVLEITLLTGGEIGSSQIADGTVTIADTNFAVSGQSTRVGNNALISNTTGTDNSALGHGALMSNTTGNSNTALGAEALTSNTTGFFNTAVGDNALLTNSTGTRNTAVGTFSLDSNTTGQRNTALGMQALSTNTTASDNTAVGFSALQDNTTGTLNTAVGSAALATNTTGSSNTALGKDALSDNTTGGDNVAVGTGALANNTTGNSNAAIGRNALLANTTAGDNTAVGDEALLSNTTGNSNTALGADSLRSNTTGILNTAVGDNALIVSTTGTRNTAMGTFALDANTTGSRNTALGTQALSASSTASDNTAVGYTALEDNTSGTLNTAVGSTALVSNTTGSSNTAVGSDALGNNTSANDNTAIGADALDSVTTGNANTAVGSGALSATTTGYLNAAVGWEALLNNTTGFGNVAVGDNALLSNTIGSSNVAVGTGAGSLLTTGSNNIAIGAGAGSDWTTSNGSNISIGNVGFPGDVGTIRIGNAQHTWTVIKGISGAVPTFFGDPVYVDSTGRLSSGNITPSSRRYKTDVHGLQTHHAANLLKLRPVTFRYKKALDPKRTKQYGLIAEEVARVMPELVVEQNGKIEGVKYQLLTIFLLAELQRQHALIEDVHVQNAQLRAQLEEFSDLKVRLAAVEAALPSAQSAPARAAMLRVQ